MVAMLFSSEPIVSARCGALAIAACCRGICGTPVVVRRHGALGGAGDPP